MTKIFHAEQNCKVLHERKRLGNFNCARVPNWYILVLILQLFHIARSLQILAYMRINISCYLRSYNIWSLLYRINVMENAFQIPFLNTFLNFWSMFAFKSGLFSVHIDISGRYSISKNSMNSYFTMILKVLLAYIYEQCDLLLLLVLI